MSFLVLVHFLKVGTHILELYTCNHMFEVDISLVCELALIYSK